MMMDHGTSSCNTAGIIIEQKSSNIMEEELMQDLLVALDDEDLTDTTLVGATTTGTSPGGRDVGEVRACRFVLAARSKVFKRMLFGEFREANYTKIELPVYSNQVLKAVVNYCTKNTLPSYKNEEGSTSIRFLVNVVSAGDYLELPCLVHHTEVLIRQKMAENPLLACSVFDEADENTVLYQCACRMIRIRPYVTLLPASTASIWGEVGGVECLKSDRIVTLMKDTEIEAGELFLFQMLQRWVDHAAEDQYDIALEVAKECGKFFRLHYIEPDILLDKVQKSGLFAPNLIVEAIMRQALKASSDRVWTINCRGKESNVDRVLVEGSGNQEVNGVYYRIRGLNKGDVHSKREVSCGQLYVYTLSCTTKDDTIESRIFCSKVLSHRGISSILAAETPPSPTIPIFQPLLQIIHLNIPQKRMLSKSSSPLSNLCKIQLSDGDHYIAGTLADELLALLENGQIMENSLVKLLSYEKYELDGKQLIHVLDLSLVSAHPGHRLGKPIEISKKEQRKNSDNADDVGDDDDDDGLQKLYSCYYPVDQQAIDSKIPRTGWKIENHHGTAPAPQCTWIPATSKKFGDISRCNSHESTEEGTSSNSSSSSSNQKR